MTQNDIFPSTQIYSSFDRLSPAAQMLVISICTQFDQLTDTAREQVQASLEFRRVKSLEIDRSELAFGQVGIIGQVSPGLLTPLQSDYEPA